MAALVWWLHPLTAPVRPAGEFPAVATFLGRDIRWVEHALGRTETSDNSFGNDTFYTGNKVVLLPDVSGIEVAVFWQRQGLNRSVKSIMVFAEGGFPDAGFDTPADLLATAGIREPKRDGVAVYDFRMHAPFHASVGKGLILDTSEPVGYSLYSGDFLSPNPGYDEYAVFASLSVHRPSKASDIWLPAGPAIGAWEETPRDFGRQDPEAASAQEEQYLRSVETYLTEMARLAEEASARPVDGQSLSDSGTEALNSLKGLDVPMGYEGVHLAACALADIYYCAAETGAGLNRAIANGLTDTDWLGELTTAQQQAWGLADEALLTLSMTMDQTVLREGTFAEREAAAGDEEEDWVYYVVCASADSEQEAEERMRSIAGDMGMPEHEVPEVFYIDESVNYGGIDDGPWLVLNGPWTDQQSASQSLDSMRQYLVQGEAFVAGWDGGGSTMSGYTPPEYATSDTQEELTAKAVEESPGSASELGGVSQEGRTLYFVTVATEESESAAQAKREEAMSSHAEQYYFIVEPTEHLDGFEPGYWVVVEAFAEEQDEMDLQWYTRFAEDPYVRQATVLCDDPIPVVEEVVEGY